LTALPGGEADPELRVVVLVGGALGVPSDLINPGLQLEECHLAAP